MSIELASRLIVFEGIDGSGKSTQLELLHARLLRAGLTVTATREPGGTHVGELVREILLSAKGTRLLPMSELLLFLVSRSQVTSEVILPALGRGDVVICSRYRMSSVAFQGYGRGLDRSMIERLNETVTQGIRPDVLFLIDVPTEVALARLGGDGDRIEREALAFHERVRQGYLELAAATPEAVVVDGTRPAAEIAVTLTSHLGL